MTVKNLFLFAGLSLSTLHAQTTTPQPAPPTAPPPATPAPAITPATAVARPPLGTCILPPKLRRRDRLFLGLKQTAENVAQQQANAVDRTIAKGTNGKLV